MKIGDTVMIQDCDLFIDFSYDMTISIQQPNSQKCESNGKVNSTFTLDKRAPQHRTTQNKKLSVTLAPQLFV